MIILNNKYYLVAKLSRIASFSVTKYGNCEGGSIIMLLELKPKPPFKFNDSIEGLSIINCPIK